VIVKMYEVLDKPVYKDKSYEYDYDFGDCWTHDITIVGRKPATDIFMCTDGEGHGAAEDAGGVHGWGNLKAAYKAQRPNKEQRDKMKWFEELASNRDSRGFTRWGREQVGEGPSQQALGRIGGQGFGLYMILLLRRAGEMVRQCANSISLPSVCPEVSLPIPLPKKRTICFV